MNLSPIKPAIHYYECHITIEPVFDKRLQIAASLAQQHHFRLADLLMQKREEDTPERSMHDTFMTGKHKNYYMLEKRMVHLINDLKYNGFTVWRYKIEDTICDSKLEDIYKLLNNPKNTS